jgi:Glycosyltransferase family 87
MVRSVDLNDVGKRFGALVTRRRVRNYAAIVLLIVVVEYIFGYATGSGFLDRYGQVKGTDFVQFYVAGQLVAAGHGSSLYTFLPPFQFPAQFAAEAQLLSPQVIDPHFAFVVPPFYALLFVPLSALAYLQAYAVWIILNACLLFLALRLLRPYVALLKGGDRRLTYLVAVSFFPVLECLFDGQNAIVSLFLLAATYVALRRRWDVLAGGALGLALYKPQLVLVLALFLLITWRWRALAGLVATGVALVGVSWAIVGTRGMLDYMSLSATSLGWLYIPGWRTWNMHSWYSFFVLLVADPAASRALTVIFTAITLAFLISAWRWAQVGPVASSNLQFALAILGTVLVSPHVFAYDLTILIIPGLLLADAGVAAIELGPKGHDGWLRGFLGVGYFIPLISRFAALELRLQLSVLVVAAIFAMTYLALSRSRRAAFPEPAATFVTAGR